MSDTLENLQKMQAIDRQKDALQQKILKRKREKDRLREEKERLEAELLSLKHALDKARLALARKELELKEVEERWATTKSKLYSGEITSSKELAQWEKSMKKLEETKDSLENEILAEMENVENLQKEFQRKGQEVTEKGTLIAQQIEVKENEIATLEAELAVLEKEWQGITSLIPPEILAYYMELRKKFQDAVVSLLGEVCQGCYLSVPTIVAKAVRRREGLVRCPNCGRFLC
ncbi:MAG: C4-type zinc ribbon domain-containing protein [Atribacterota bacterium]